MKKECCRKQNSEYWPEEVAVEVSKNRKQVKDGRGRKTGEVESQRSGRPQAYATPGKRRNETRRPGRSDHRTTCQSTRMDFQPVGCSPKGPRRHDGYAHLPSLQSLPCLLYQTRSLQGKGHSRLPVLTTSPEPESKPGGSPLAIPVKGDTSCQLPGRSES